MIHTHPLGSVVDVSAGQPAPAASELADEGIPFIRAGSLEKLLSGGSLAECEKVPSETALKNRLRLFPQDSVVFAKSGMSATLGRVYRLSGPAYVVSHLAVLVPTGNYDPGYLTHWLRHNPPSHLINDPAYPSIRVSDIEKLPVPAITTSEQKRIASILDKAESVCRKQEQSLAMAGNFMKSVFLDMFGHPVDPRQRRVPTTLGKHCNFFAGNSLPNGEEFRSQEGGILLLKVSDLNLEGNESVVQTAKAWASESAAIGGTIAPKGAIVFPKRGGAIATNKKRILGRKAALDPNLMAVAPKTGSTASEEFLRMWFELLDLNSISSGSTVPQLNKKDLDRLPFAAPDDGEIQRFNQISRAVSSATAPLQHAARESETLFAALSQRAFRGEL